VTKGDSGSYNRRVTLTSRPSRYATHGASSIGALLLAVFVAGLLVAALAVYSTYASYRQGTVLEMARADAQRISHLVFEHIYAVMRKGWTRNEIDDVIHHIQSRLPDYEVKLIRGEPVVRQFGDRPGHAELRERDPLLRGVLAGGPAQAQLNGEQLRYVYPIRMTGECVGCHTQSAVGEVNGAISISAPTHALTKPIESIVQPAMQLALVLIGCVLLITYLVLHFRVTRPITELSEHVSALAREKDYSRDLESGTHWPREVCSLGGHFNALMGQVRESHAQLREASLRDPMTRLFNRRHFDAAMERAVLDARNGSTPFTVFLIDLDRFKPINDMFGHAAGDAVLVSVAKSLQATLRETDLAARIGGDEFAVLALATTRESADEVAERLRTAIGTPELRFGHEVVRPACSIGFGCFPEDGESAPQLLQAADTAMYNDKAQRRSGR
jgi:c-di-GMP phosphodiesterase